MSIEASALKWIESFQLWSQFFFFPKFWAWKPSSQYILSFKDFLFAIFDRELMTKSLLKYFLKEGVSLQPLSWMWGLVWIAILLCYCQLRYELFQCLFSLSFKPMRSSLNGTSPCKSMVEGVHVIYQLKTKVAYHFMILIIIQAPNIMYIAKAYSKYLL